MTKIEKTIAIFPVKEKKTNSHPDYTGQIKEGEKIIYDVALWWNESKTGLKYLKGKINEPREQK